MATARPATTGPYRGTRAQEDWLAAIRIGRGGWRRITFIGPELVVRPRAISFPVIPISGAQFIVAME